MANNVNDPNKDERIIGTGVKIFGAIIALLFIILGFIVRPGGNGVFLYDALHPVTILDIVGSILFLGGMALLLGFLQPLTGQLYNKENSSALNIGTVAAMALGIVLIFI